MTRFTLSLAATLMAATSAVAAEFSIRRFESNPAQIRSGAVRVDHGDLLFSGQLISEPEGPIDDQIAGLLQQTTDLLTLNRLAPADLVRLNLYVADDADVPSITTALSKWLDPAHRPAVSWVMTSLPKPGSRVGLDLVAARDPARAPATARDRLTSIPSTANTRVFISGQAEKGDGTVADATTQTMASLFRTLEFLKLTPGDVVHVKVFIAPMTQSDQSLAAVRKAFGKTPCPPVVFVEWQSP